MRHRSRTEVRSLDLDERSFPPSAAQGKVDDTIVPLNATRELAKLGGLSFDEAAALGDGNNLRILAAWASIWR